MRVSDLKVGDIVEKPPFWSKPMKIVEIWHDGADHYADVADATGERSWCPLRLGLGYEGHLIHQDIKTVWRDGEVIFSREIKNEAK